MADPGTQSSGTLTGVAVGLTGTALLGLSVSAGILQGHTQEESAPSSSVGRWQVGEASKPHRHIFHSDRGLQAFPESRSHSPAPEGALFYHHLSATPFRARTLFYSLRQILSFPLFSLLKSWVGWESKRPVGNSRGGWSVPLLLNLLVFQDLGSRTIAEP